MPKHNNKFFEDLENVFESSQQEQPSFVVEKTRDSISSKDISRQYHVDKDYGRLIKRARFYAGASLQDTAVCWRLLTGEIVSVNTIKLWQNGCFTKGEKPHKILQNIVKIAIKIRSKNYGESTRLYNQLGIWGED